VLHINARMICTITKISIMSIDLHGVRRLIGYLLRGS
jgi:hypothetical protein